MRTIKFRAWDNKLKRMWDWEELQRLPMADFEREDLVWLQFTGLKSKSGVEIYEGDVVQIDGSGASKDPHIIRWDKRGAWKVGEKTFELGFYRIQVIGNVFENKNLLGE